MRCISREQGKELLEDIHGRDCGHHSSSWTLIGKAFRSGFYWPTALNDAVELVKACEACQFHAKQIHQPAGGLLLGNVVISKKFLRTRKIMVMHSNERGECDLRTLVDQQRKR